MASSPRGRGLARGGFRPLAKSTRRASSSAGRTGAGTKERGATLLVADAWFSGAMPRLILALKRYLIRMRTLPCFAGVAWWIAGVKRAEPCRVACRPDHEATEPRRVASASQPHLLRRDLRRPRGRAGLPASHGRRRHGASAEHRGCGRRGLIRPPPLTRALRAACEEPGRRGPQPS